MLLLGVYIKQKNICSNFVKNWLLFKGHLIKKSDFLPCFPLKIRSRKFQEVGKEVEEGVVVDVVF